MCRNLVEAFGERRSRKEVRSSNLRHAGRDDQHVQSSCVLSKLPEQPELPRHQHERKKACLKRTLVPLMGCPRSLGSGPRTRPNLQSAKQAERLPVGGCSFYWYGVDSAGGSGHVPETYPSSGKNSASRPKHATPRSGIWKAVSSWMLCG